jgi:hypothetical protein
MLLRLLKRLYTFRGSINFIYYDSARNYGSTTMRGKQLSLIAQKALGKRVYFTSTDYQYKNCMLFLTKWAIYKLSLKELKKLKAGQNKLIFDLVDGELPAKKIKFADVVVAAAESIFKKYKRILPKTVRMVLIDHHADPRIRFVDWSVRPKKLKVGYFGELINTLITPKIKQRVDFIPVSNITQNSDWFNKLPKYNLHYAIRQKRDVYPNKPFLKGFTAAHCDANILIQASDKEAIKWLGKDYPYLLKGRVTEEKVIKMLDYIKKSYGSKEWDRGLSIMRSIREKTSEEAIGKQLIELFQPS